MNLRVFITIRYNHHKKWLISNIKLFTNLANTFFSLFTIRGDKKYLSLIISNLIKVYILSSKKEYIDD